MKRLIFILTNLCNMKCPFCNRAKDNKSIPFVDFKNILDQAKKQGFDFISLTGGEVCLHPQFDKIIKLLVKGGFKFSLVSNGYLYKNYKYLLKYRNFRNITFSIDGTKETHDSLRGKGSFEKVCKAVRYFSNRIPTSTAICLNKFNLKDLEYFLKLSKSLGSQRYVVATTNPDKSNLEYLLTDKQKKDTIKKLEILKKKYPINISNTVSLGSSKKGINFCRGLSLNTLTINPKSELAFCCDISQNSAVLGSLREYPLKFLIKRAAMLANALKKKRFIHYRKKSFFEGFDTCLFCHKYLKNLVD